MNSQRPEDPPATVIPLHALRAAQLPARASGLAEQDRRGLIPLAWGHLNPYGKFSLNVGGDREG